MLNAIEFRIQSQRRQWIVEVEFDENSSLSDKSVDEIDSQQQQQKEPHLIMRGRNKWVHKAP